MKYQSISYRIFTVFNYTLMFCVILVTALPYLHVLAKALNDGTDTMLGGVLFWPRVPTLDNFATLFRDASMYRAILVTIVRVLVGLGLGIAVQFMAGYGLTREGLPYKAAIMVFFVIPMFFNGGIIPQYMLYSKMKLLNTFWIYVLPSAFVFFHMVIIRSYIMSSIPTSIEEAARIDGMGEFGIFAKIIMPLSKPILATVGLWIAVAHWNDWTTTLYFVQNERLHTLLYKLMQLIKESERIQQLMVEAAKAGNATGAMANVQSTPEAVVSAQVIITTVPIIMVYPFLQKYFIHGVTLGAVKG